MKPLVSIITVTYNSQDLIVDCLKSVIKHTSLSHEIIVVDNASTDETTSVLEKAKLNIRLIKSDQNLGFGAGNQLGVNQASGEYLFFLNPDTKFRMDTLTPLVDYLAKHDQVGLVAPKLVNNQGKPQESIRNLPTLTRAIQEFWFNQSNRYEAFSPNTDQPMIVESVVGAAMLIQRQLFNDLGGWDKRYFMYFEDLELCRQLKKQQLQVVVLPTVTAEHQVGASASTNSKTHQFLIDSAKVYHGNLEFQLIILVRRIRHIFDRLTGYGK